MRLILLACLLAVVMSVTYQMGVLALAKSPATVEYLVSTDNIIGNGFATDETRTAVLNKFAKDGWQLRAAVGGVFVGRVILIFERQVR